jgi:four helix bundle protein
MAPARSFQDLIVWQKAYQFVLFYRLTDSFPRREIYGLTSQMRRAAVSITANIAEGFRRRGKSDKARFMNVSQGSVEESRCYLFLCRDLNYGETTV